MTQKYLQVSVWGLQQWELLWGWEVFYITGVSFECFQMF